MTDVHGACLALVQHLTGRGGVVPLPAALGWQLERTGTGLQELATQCAAVTTGEAAWSASAVLGELLGEYRAVRRGGRTVTASRR